jgi:hypothetical protein
MERFIDAIFSLLMKIKNGKSQKRGGDFTENRKK